MNNDALSFEEEKLALEILEQIWQLPEQQRSAYLEQACDGNASLKEYVVEVLYTPVDPMFLPTAKDRSNFVPAEWNGVDVGSYQVEHCIARGGMGDVYLAKRTDGSFEKRVAIKFIRRDLRVDLRHRFSQERQILAKLQHPNIAQLLDGGQTDEGTLYYVMEYVEGLPINQHCRKYNFDTNKILTLFAKVCSAVFAAHSQLVIHRDLKPENILVSEDNEPKLLDFGIAKMLDTDTANERSLLSGLTTLNPMTPRYASPEQIQQQPLGVASDIYSLGVILYELLTGISPYGNETDSPLALSQSIVHKIPPRPSLAISKQRTELQPQPIQVEATVDYYSVASKQINRDLDSILLKALEKDPSRRYSSAQSLANDLIAATRGLPVTARAPSTWYLSSKFIARHKYGAFATATIASLILFATLSNYRHLKAIENQYLVLIEQQRQIKEQSELSEKQAQDLSIQEQLLLEEQQRIKQINQQILAKDQLISKQQEIQQTTAQQLSHLDNTNEALSQEVEKLAESAARRTEKLFSATQQYLALIKYQYWTSKNSALTILSQQRRDIERLFENELNYKNQLLIELGYIYHDLDLVQESLSINEQIDNFIDRQQEQFQTIMTANANLRALNLYSLGQISTSAELSSSVISGYTDRPPLSYLIAAKLSLFNAQLDSGMMVPAEAQLQQLRQHSRPTISAEQAILILKAEADLHSKIGNWNDAVDFYLRAQQLLSETDHKNYNPFLPAQLSLNLATAHRHNGESDKAIESLAIAENTIQKFVGWKTLLFAAVELEKADTLHQQKKLNQVEPLLRSVLHNYETTLGQHHSSTLRAQLHYGQNLMQLGKYKSALVNINTLIERMEQGENTEKTLLFSALILRSEILNSLQQYQLAIADIKTVLGSTDSKNLSHFKVLLAKNLILTGETNQALALLNDLETNTIALQSPIFFISYQRALGLYWESMGDSETALDYYFLAYNKAETVFADDDSVLADIDLELGRVLYYQDRLRDAERHMEQALAIYEKQYSPNHPQMVRALQYLSALETSKDKTGRFRKTKDYFEKAHRLQSEGEESTGTNLDCYLKTTEVFTPAHSYMVDYWFFNSDLFLALAHNNSAYDEIQSAAAGGLYINNSGANRKAIKCFEEYLEKTELTPKFEAATRAQLGILYSSIRNLPEARNHLLAAKELFQQQYGDKNPKIRFIEQSLQGLQ